MKRIISTLGVMIAGVGICGLLSVIVQYIIFHDMPPTPRTIITGTVFAAIGITLYQLNKRVFFKNNETDELPYGKRG